jgi:hypothetical protein
MRRCGRRWRRCNRAPTGAAAKVIPSQIDSLGGESRSWLAAQQVTSASQNVSAECLALLGKNHPNLAKLIQVWPRLPVSTRAGLVAMAEAMLDGAG